ncbi:cyclophane-forming radical SAM peptide maturase AmcB [Longispora sp. NPDC051575]|uniref:cyclophane-forming radical SAM peptide maturase AmcB n=1 Tax=Longispora sp. NPDC051575 TaxID=3154943 RepID=UPI00342EBA5A
MDTLAPQVIRPPAVILQPTTLCNLDCTYCYLPFRKLKNTMSTEVLDAVASGLAGWNEHGPTEIVWHGGEPMLVGAAGLDAMMARFDGLDVRHSIQTNGVLVDDAWCELFTRRSVHVGVSVDGPEEFNRYRLNLAGRPSWAQTMRGIAKLRERDVPFSAIAVVSHPFPALAQEFYDFFAQLGCTSVGVNIEEQEGVNTRHTGRSTVRMADFWAALTTAWRANPVIGVREIGYVLDHLARDRAPGGRGIWVDPLPTVGWDGSVTLLSPEMAGFDSPEYGDFACGNVLETPLPALVDAGLRERWPTEFLAGVARCREICTFFDFCGGGHPGNKYFEHGRFDVTETDYCRNSKIALLQGVRATL